MKRAIWIRLVVLALGLSLFAFPAAAQQMVHVKAAPSGPDVTTTSSAFEDIPGLRAFFVAGQDGNACISVSGEFSVTSGQRMFLRALIDGVATSPSDVTLSSDAYGTTTFHFAANVTAGLHAVRIQWLVDPGGTASVGDRTVWLTTAPNVVNTIAAPSGPDVTTTSSSFADIPNLPTNITLPGPGDAIITLTAETGITGGGRLFVRALIDGAPANPSDVVFTVENNLPINAFTFVAPGLSAGSHTLNVQWLVDAGSTGFMGDRTVTIAYSNPADLAAGNGGIIGVAAPSGAALTTTSSSFVDVPDMSATITTPENASIVIGMQAEIYSTATHRIFLQATVDGQPASPSDVLYHYEGFIGTRSFYFVAKNLRAGTHSVKMRWLVDSGGTASVGDRTMTVLALPTQNHTANCWWFNSAEQGTGVSIEVQADRLFLAWYSYDQTTGRPIWNTAGGPMTDPFTFSGSLMQFSGWELGTSYVAPSSAVVGNVTVEFDHSDYDLGSISWTVAGSSGSKTIEKFMPFFVGGDQDERNINGWWWDPAFDGMGVYVEARGGQIFIAWYQYRADGSPRWWSVGGAFAPGATSFTGVLQERANGQWIGGPYQAPDAAMDVDPVSFTFNADGSATLAWSGTTFNLERFPFAD